MKVTAFILFGMFSLVNMEPLLMHATCMAELVAATEEASCCSGESHCDKMPEAGPDKETDADDNQPPACNPFMACFSCYYLNDPETGMEPPLFTGLSASIRSANENIHSSYLADCWRPPEVA